MYFREAFAVPARWGRLVAMVLAWEVRAMFRRTRMAALTALAALVGCTLARAEEPKAAKGKDAKAVGGEKQITSSTGMKLVLIPSGEFLMGNGESAEATATFYRNKYATAVFAADLKDEYPQHRVRITRPYYLGKFQVTRGQFRQFIDATQYRTESEKAKKPGADGWDPSIRGKSFGAEYSWRNVGFEQTDKHPVVNVSWNDSVAFCKWLSKKDGKTYRLPTEAEWEYACRAGTATRYYSGDDPETLVQVGNVADRSLALTSLIFINCIKANDGYAFTSPVGRFKPNAYELYDMHGNVYQWCQDWYQEEYYAASPTDDPPGPKSGTYRALRGGSWYDGPLRARSNERFLRAPDEPSFDVGFRVVRSQ